MRIFISRWFRRFARKEQLGGSALWEAILRAEKGNIDADLGGGVIKQRIARAGQGRSGSYRAIIVFRPGLRAFFIYGFSKSQRANIDEEERRQFKEAAKHILAVTDKQLAELLRRGDFVEVNPNGQDLSK